MHYFKSLSILMLSCILATGASAKSRAEKDFDKTRQMCESLYDSPKIRPIKSKILPRDGGWSPIQFADKSVPTDADKKALEAYFDALVACRHLWDGVFKKHNVTVGIATDRWYRDQQNQIDAALYNAEISYGQAAKLKSQAVQEANKLRDEEIQQAPPPSTWSGRLNKAMQEYEAQKKTQNAPTYVQCKKMGEDTAIYTFEKHCGNGYYPYTPR